MVVFPAQHERLLSEKTNLGLIPIQA